MHGNSKVMIECHAEFGQVLAHWQSRSLVVTKCDRRHEQWNSITINGVGSAPATSAPTPNISGDPMASGENQKLDYGRELVYVDQKDQLLGRLL